MKKRMIVLIALVAVVSLMPASAETLEVRGDVVSIYASNPELVWDAHNFAAFWYDMDDDLQTEMLTLKADVLNGFTCDRTIDEDALRYTTYAIYQEYELHENEGLTVESGNLGGDTGYWIEGFMAEEYVAIDNNADKLSKLLVEFKDDNRTTLTIGERYNLSGGFALELTAIDAAGKKATIRLFKGGNPIEGSLKCIDTGTGNEQDRVYTYTANIGGKDDIPVCSCYVDAISGENETIQIKYLFLIDDDVMEIDLGDTYGIMEVMTASKSGVTLRNNDVSLDLDTDTKEQIMGNIYVRTADDCFAIRFYPMVECTEPGTYEVRGGIVNLIGTDSNSELVLNALNFGAFWYDLDDDLQTETLILMAGVLNEATNDRTIDEDTLIYTTHSVPQEYELYENENITVKSGNLGGDKEYWLEGWMGEKYVAIDNNSDKLCKLLLEFKDDDAEILFTGEKWDLGGGFALELLGIDDTGDKVTLRLFKNDTPLEGSLKCITTDAGKQKRVYTYTADIGGKKNIPVFSCYVNAVFKGDVSYTQLMYAFLIDDNVLRIKTGDKYSAMEVMTASKSGIILRNNDEVIDLDPGTTKNITENVYFKTADDDAAIRFYPFVERTTGDEGPTPPPATIPAKDIDGDGVPDVWDADNSTPLDYWVNSDGIGRRWGDMNGDGKLTSADALMILQAAVGKIELR